MASTLKNIAREIATAARKGEDYYWDSETWNGEVVDEDTQCFELQKDGKTYKVLVREVQ